MNKRRFSSVIATLALVAGGAQVAVGLGNSAYAAPASHGPLDVHTTGPKTYKPLSPAIFKKAQFQSPGIKGADVAPLSNFSPACYGDSRPTSGGTGPDFIPQTFGAFFNCAGVWTFEVQTSDQWALNSLGQWIVQIDTDGNPNNNCFGFEYAAIVQQDPNTDGLFEAGVVSLDSQCNTTFISGATFNYTSNTAAITFASSAIAPPGQSSPSILWNGLLGDRNEELTGTGGNTGIGGDAVPAPNAIYGGVEGAVTEAAPSGPSPTAAQCTALGAGTAQVASTSDSHRAASALQKAGFSKVHDYGEGIISFSGDVVTASQILSAAGLSSKISPSEPFHVAGTFSGTPNDPQVPNQWNLNDVNATGAWAVTTGSNVVVADVDTGVDFTQPDLPSPQLVPGIDESVTPPAAISSGNTDTGQSESGHGTAVAGVIAAATNNSTDVASLGWHSSVLPVKVNLDATTAPLPDAQIAAGIEWAANNGPAGPHPSEDVRVINLSLQSPCDDGVVKTAVTDAQNNGVLVVAAAGNMALSQGFDQTPNDLAFNNPPSYPAADANVLAVGATGREGLRAYYSNTGNYVSVVAPGGSADVIDNGNGTFSENTANDMVLLAPITLANPSGLTTGAGTSFAAPQVAATAALILSVNPNLTPSQVTELITGSATDMGVAGRDIEYGYGMLNAGVALADTPPPATGTGALPTYGTFVSLPPARILDTRNGTGASPAPIGPGQEIDLQVTGHGGVPASGVSAVVLNTTVTSPTAASFLTVWPQGQTRPLSSNLNFVPGETVPNLVTVKVGPTGQVSLFNANGNVEAIADVAGYYTDGTTASPGSTFKPLAPFRALDTRNGTGAPQAPIGPGGTVNLQVTGVDGIPASATGVVMNVTVTSPTQASFLTVYPSDALSRPLASNLNFVPGQTVPNLVNVQLSQTGLTPGQVTFYNANGNVQVVADIQGYFTAAGDTTGSRYFPLVNHRILDSRFNVGGIFGPLGPGGTWQVPITGQGGVLDGATSVVMNTTVTQPTALSFLTVYPNGTTRPTASDLNFVANETVPNLVTAAIGTNGLDDFYNAVGNVFVLSDVAGYYGAAGA